MVLKYFNRFFFITTINKCRMGGLYKGIKEKKQLWIKIIDTTQDLGSLSLSLSRYSNGLKEKNKKAQYIYKLCDSQNIFYWYRHKTRNDLPSCH